MAQSKLYPVVMAGGSGSRLWPLSRVLYPKQFLCLKGDLTMLQTTICRLNGVECESPVVICNEQHRFIVAEQLRQLNKLTENIILEPAGRNTAPAIALAALAAKRHSPESDPLMLVLAADHVIADEDAFRTAVRNAMPYAEAGNFATLFRSTSRLRIIQRICLLYTYPACTVFPFPARAFHMRPYSSDNAWYRNLNLLSIACVLRPVLRPRLTQSRSALLWKP